MSLTSYMTPFIYSLLTLIWLATFLILAFQLIKNKDHDQSVKILLFILAIDAFRTLFESSFFGILYSSELGFLPHSFSFLSDVNYLRLIPKVLNLITGSAVLILLTLKWLPRLLTEHYLQGNKVKDLQSEAIKKEIIEQRLTLEHSRDQEFFKIFQQLQNISEKSLLEETLKLSLRLMNNSQGSIHLISENNKLITTSIWINGSETYFLHDHKTSEVFMDTNQLLLNRTFIHNDVENISEEIKIYSDEYYNNFSHQLVTSVTSNYELKLIISVSNSKESYKLIDQDLLENTLEKILIQIKYHQSQKELLESKIEAEKASQAKSNFLATMSHEIRTPMNVVVGMGDILLESDLSEQNRYYVDLIQQSGNTLLDLINNILDLSKIEAGQFDLCTSPYDLKTVIKKLCLLMEKKAHTKSLSLTLNIDESFPNIIIGDQSRIRQILLNLISNSIKFTESGLINIQLTYNKESIFIRVKDTGSGIGAEHLDTIFNKFTQVDSTLMREQGGTGLGLSITKQIVELMGGTISVESIFGKGSIFSVEIPLVVLPKEMRPRKTEKKVEPSIDLKDFNLLIVDDAEFNRFLVETYLKETSCSFDTASNGDEAVKYIKENNYDIVLMDIQMPIKDGLTATSEIREWERANNKKHHQIIALTANALEQDEKQSLDAGCDLHLIKPIKKKTLFETLSKCEKIY